MSDERGFLDRLLAAPADDTTRLVYADWLDEAGTPSAAARAEFLRLEAELDRARKGGRKAIKTRLRELAAGLDTDWLAVVSKLGIENCPAGRTAVGRRALRTVEFEYQCPKAWEHLRPTADAAVRFCDACRENVYYCDTITAARDHVERGHCVAVDFGIPRRVGDLERRPIPMGFISPEYFRREDERMKPDPVSEARERRKRAADG